MRALTASVVMIWAAAAPAADDAMLPSVADVTNLLGGAQARALATQYGAPPANTTVTITNWYVRAGTAAGGTWWEPDGTNEPIERGYVTPEVTQYTHDLQRPWGECSIDPLLMVLYVNQPTGERFIWGPYSNIVVGGLSDASTWEGTYTFLGRSFTAHYPAGNYEGADPAYTVRGIDIYRMGVTNKYLMDAGPELGRRTMRLDSFHFGDIGYPGRMSHGSAWFTLNPGLPQSWLVEHTVLGAPPNVNPWIRWVAPWTGYLTRFTNWMEECSIVESYGDLVTNRMREGYCYVQTAAQVGFGDSGLGGAMPDLHVIGDAYDWADMGIGSPVERAAAMICDGGPYLDVSKATDGTFAGITNWVDVALADGTSVWIQTATQTSNRYDLVTNAYTFGTSTYYVVSITNVLIVTNSVTVTNVHLWPTNFAAATQARLDLMQWTVTTGGGALVWTNDEQDTTWHWGATSNSWDAAVAACKARAPDLTNDVAGLPYCYSYGSTWTNSGGEQFWKAECTLRRSQLIRTNYYDFATATVDMDAYCKATIPAAGATFNAYSTGVASGVWQRVESQTGLDGKGGQTGWIGGDGSGDCDTQPDAFCPEPEIGAPTRDGYITTGAATVDKWSF